MSSKVGRKYHVVQCPFYKWDTASSITCTGLIACSSINISFGNRSDLLTHLNEHCKKDWVNCPITHMLWDYEDKRCTDVTLLPPGTKGKVD